VADAPRTRDVRPARVPWQPSAAIGVLLLLGADTVWLMKSPKMAPFALLFILIVVAAVLVDSTTSPKR